MPTYTYACTACGHTFDQVQAFHDAALTTCGECQGTLRKVYNSVGVVFKGSGFYRTDSRSGSSASASAPAASTTPPSTSSTTTSSTTTTSTTPASS